MSSSESQSGYQPQSEDEWAEERFSSYLTLSTIKAGFLSFLPFSSSLTNKSAHVTSLLETLNGFPLHLEKIRSAYQEWQGPPRPGFCSSSLPLQCFPSSFCSGHTACRRVPAQARLAPTSQPLPCHVFSLASSRPSGLHSNVTHSERPSPTILYGSLPVAIFFLLWVYRSSLFHLYASEMFLFIYLLIV